MTPKRFSLEEANRLLPTLQTLLPKVRGLRDRLSDQQTRIDVERVTGASVGALHHLLKDLHVVSAEFHGALASLHDLGVELKDLDLGLVDFPSDHDGEVVYLCWKEGETRITHWHPLEGGYAQRRPLAPPADSGDGPSRHRPLDE